MAKNKVKFKNYVTNENIGSVSTDIPWEPSSSKKPRLNGINIPNDFLIYHGSACASMATTSALGTYILKENQLRLGYDNQGDPVIDNDSFIVTPDKKLYQISKSALGENHWLHQGHPILKEIKDPETQVKIKEHFNIKSSQHRS